MDCGVVVVLVNVVVVVFAIFCDVSDTITASSLFSSQSYQG